MSQTGDDALAELISREQRGFRRILYAGLATLILMALMSAALGAYLYVASQSLSATTRTLQQNAFDTRRRVDAQNNRLVAQEIALRRAYDEIRAGGEARYAATPANLATATEAARAFLLRGREPNLAEKGMIRQLGAESADPARALLAGVAAILEFQERGGQIDAASALPERLTAALQSFEAARADAGLVTVASAGVGWVRFAEASARNFTGESCAEVFTAVDASVPDGVPSPQPLYWRAQCERKLGRTSDSFGNYARAVTDSARSAGEAERDAAELLLAMNAYHGAGTTLIAGTDDIADGDPALEVVREACAVGDKYAERSPRMALALACLDEAVALRRALGQTNNQLSGSAENISFAHLRDGDFTAAYENTVAVERTGLFAWNEVVRALAAPRASFDDARARRAAAAAAEDARRNVSLFTVGQFNLCELRVLFDADMYAAAVEIIADTHPGEEVGCPTAS